MADNAESPSVKDLPKISDNIKDELVGDVQLKHIEVSFKDSTRLIKTILTNII
jgi:hypothetical protein